MGSDEIRFAAVRSVRLSGGSKGELSLSSAVDPLTRFKREQLRCIALDEPWDTALTWADAQTDLPEIDVPDRDRVVAEALMQLHDEGLVYFFEVSDFGDSYSRTPPDEDKLTRERLAEVLSAGSRAEEGEVAAPLLGVRATQKGRGLAVRLAADMNRGSNPKS